MDWFPAVMTLIGVLVGVGIQEIRIWRERKDKYKDMVFERRLDAHQGAYYWCMRLYHFLMPQRLMKVEGVEAAFKEAKEAYEWINRNALYLDEGSLEKMEDFVLYAYETCSKYGDEKEKKNINIENELLKLAANMGGLSGSIKKGIGAKYLPKTKISGKNIEIEETFDEVVGEVKELIRKQKE